MKKTATGNRWSIDHTSPLRFFSWGGLGGVASSGRAWFGWTLATAVSLAFLGLFFLWPVATLVSMGLVSNGQFTAAGFSIFAEPRTWRIIGTTLSLGVSGAVACTVLGVPGAYLLYRVAFPGRRWLRALVAVPFALPTVVVGVAFRTLFRDTALDETYLAIVAALVFFNYSVVVRTVGSMWAALDTRAEEAARTLGASPARVWWTVTWPRLAPAVASASALVFLYCASAYGIIMVMGGVRYATLETEIWYQTTQLLDLPAASALSLVQLVVIAASLWVVNRFATAGLRLRGAAATDVAWNWGRHWPLAATGGFVVGGIILAPLVLLVFRSFSTPDGFGLDNYRMLLQPIRGVGVTAWQSLVVSLQLAGLAGLLSVTLGLAVSLILSRRPRPRWLRAAQRVFDSAFMLPLGVSAVTVGFGFLVTLNRPPLDLRTSLVLVPIAQALVALPLVVRLLLPVLRAIDPGLREVAATLGARDGRVLATIDFPAIRRGLGLAIGFAFATSLGEFGATSFLARPDTPTLSVLIFRLMGRPGAEAFGTAMAASVVLGTVTATVMFVSELLRPKEASG